MSFLRYPEYKDSGVEWLGEVPGHRDLEPPRPLAEIDADLKRSMDRIKQLIAELAG